MAAFKFLLLCFSGLHTERTVGTGDEEEASIYEADAEIGALKKHNGWGIQPHSDQLTAFCYQTCL